MTDATFSSNIRSYLKPGTFLLRYLIVINLILGAWYLEWRITYSINFAALWISLLLLFAEIYSYLGGAIFLTGFWQPVVRSVKSFSQMSPPFPVDDWPAVDVFITCYNEPVEIVEETTRAALALDYPQTKLFVYVLDDGNSPAMRKMTEILGLEDLQSAPLQAASDRINQKRNCLEQKLQELEIFSSQIKNIEGFLERFQLKVLTQRSELEKVLSWLDKIRQPGIPDEVWYKFVLAIGEGFDNILKYAHKNLPDETPISLEVTFLNNYLALQIWDRGVGFDLEKYMLELPEDVSENAESGRGFLILQEIADYISYNQIEGQGNCLLIIQSYVPENPDREQNLSACLQSLGKIILTLNPKYGSIRDYVDAEKQKIKYKIAEQELALTNLIRCRYIARPKPKGRPHHAKAGNINYALFSGETFGDFILTLDADHVPKPQLLQRVLPYFYKYNLYSGDYEVNQIALVQTPQVFKNIPEGDPFGHQAHLFYGPIQQAKDGMNAAFYTGTNAVLRREALISVGLQYFSEEYEQDEKRLQEFDFVGGVSSHSITEDMNTAMRLHASGWKTAYHHEELAVGLAPDDLSSTLQQRLRWAQGTIQVLLRENPLTKPGLSFGQQLQYFQTMYSYFSGFFAFIFIICPIIYFYTGIIPVTAYGADFAIHFIPVFICNRLTFIVAGWGIPAGELWRAEQYAIALFPVFIQSVWSVFTRTPIKFKVTPKQSQSGIYLRLVWVQLSLVVLTVLGIIWTIYRWIGGDIDAPGVYLVNGFWSVYNISLLIVIIRAAVWQPKSS